MEINKVGLRKKKRGRGHGRDRKKKDNKKLKEKKEQEVDNAFYLLLFSLFLSYMSPRLCHGEMNGNLIPKENSYLINKKCFVQNPNPTLHLQPPSPGGIHH